MTDLLWRLSVALLAGVAGVLGCATLILWLEHAAPCRCEVTPNDDAVWAEEDDPTWETQRHDA